MNYLDKHKRKLFTSILMTSVASWLCAHNRSMTITSFAMPLLYYTINTVCTTAFFYILEPDLSKKDFYMLADILPTFGLIFTSIVTGSFSQYRMAILISLFRHEICDLFVKCYNGVNVDNLAMCINLLGNESINLYLKTVHCLSNKKMSSAAINSNLQRGLFCIIAPYLMWHHKFDTLTILAIGVFAIPQISDVLIECQYILENKCFMYKNHNDTYVSMYSNDIKGHERKTEASIA